MVPKGTTNANFPISTRLHADAWEAALQRASFLNKYADVPKGIHEGFCIGIEDTSLSRTFIPDNHFKSDIEADIIRSKFAEEIQLGRLSPGFNPNHLESLNRNQENFA
ncbi:hypothetical protein F5051DRAFT_341580 [Lentinula edodes]|nr:hypothetical protein F5051DRAFT_341580 [Lentinula edodes]